MNVLDDYMVDPRLSLLDKTRIQAQVLVPVLRALRAELGKEKADAIVRQALRDWSKQLFAAVGESVEGSPRRKWAAMHTALAEVTEREVTVEMLPARQGGAGIRRHALPLRGILSRARRARARRAAGLRDRFRYRRGRRQRGRPHARPDPDAGRAELHVPLQVRAADRESAQSREKRSQLRMMVAKKPGLTGLARESADGSDSGASVTLAQGAIIRLLEGRVRPQRLPDLRTRSCSRARR